MFILKSTHRALLTLERERSDALVSQMQEQISDLRRLVFVPTPTPAETLPVRLANAVLDGVEVMPKSDPEQDSEDLAEANRILSGTYDRVEDTW